MWKLKKELGLRYRSRGPDECEPVLEFPILAAPLRAERMVVVDQTTTGARRVLVLDRNGGGCLFDSFASGLSDAYACPVTGDAFILLSVEERTLYRFDGVRLIAPTSLRAASPYAPTLAGSVPGGGTMVAFVDRPGIGELACIDLGGGVRWKGTFAELDLVCPSSVIGLPGGRALVADEERHCVSVVGGGVRSEVRFGAPGTPGRGATYLSSPKSAFVHGADVIVADARNHRLLAVSPDGDARLVPVARELFCPTSVVAGGEGRFIVTDGGNQRILEVGPDGEVIWETSLSRVAHRTLSFPRSVVRSRGERYLVADTCNDRLIELDGGGRAHPIPHPKLRWPRCARRTTAGTVLVADALNRRIVELSRDGRIISELGRLRGLGVDSLLDPHDVRQLPGGELLVTDSALGLVLVVSWSGDVLSRIGGDARCMLSDPHSAQDLDATRVLVSDPGNDRVIIASRAGEILRTFTSADGGGPSLKAPRYAESHGPKGALVCDTGNDRVIALDEDGTIIWGVDRAEGSPCERFRKPRWATISGGELIVADHYNHRVLVFDRTGGRARVRPRPRSSVRARTAFARGAGRR